MYSTEEPVQSVQGVYQLGRTASQIRLDAVWCPVLRDEKTRRCGSQTFLARFRLKRICALHG